MKNYYIGKAQARQRAIDWQLETSDKVMSWGEVAIWGEYFYKLAKRFGLVREFKENGVL